MSWTYSTRLLGDCGERVTQRDSVLVRTQERQRERTVPDTVTLLFNQPYLHIQTYMQAEACIHACMNTQYMHALQQHKVHTCCECRRITYFRHTSTSKYRTTWVFLLRCILLGCPTKAECSGTATCLCLPKIKLALVILGDEQMTSWKDMQLV